MFSGEWDGLDIFLVVALGVILAAFFYIVWSYARGLRGSPRELYLMFFTKVTEYSAYGAAQMAFIPFLHKDLELSDEWAGVYIGAFSLTLSLVTMIVGAVCDAIGVKKTLLLGCYLLLFSRFFMPLLNDIWLVTILGFLPLAAGIAITTPVLYVGIKKFTTREGAALGFGLFYTMMNVGWAIGGWIFDAVRTAAGAENAQGEFIEYQHHPLPLFDVEISTYQIIIAVGFFLTIPDLIAILLMRPNVEMTEKGIKFFDMKTVAAGPNMLVTTVRAMREASADTGRVLRKVFGHKAFWIFLGLIGILVFVRLTFYHFHYTFPTYGIRVFGEGAKVGNMWGVLNPVLIVFLVPLIAALTRKTRSYKMMLIGTSISVLSVFIATFNPEIFRPLIDTAVGELIFDRWLDVPVERQDPFYLALITFIVIFTIGEAIWSPRLMQFTAEIAPIGQEGSYVAMAALPYFAAKFIAGPMSGILLATYVPEGQDTYPAHYMVWVWIGLMAALSPAGLLIFRRWYRRAEDEAEAEAIAAAEADAEEAAGSDESNPGAADDRDAAKDEDRAETDEPSDEAERGAGDGDSGDAAGDAAADEEERSDS